MPYIGKQLVRGQNRELDDISSSFNGFNTVFNLTVSGDSITPGSALQLFISVGGVLQNPNTDFTVAGNQITFTTAPGTGLSFFGILQGDAVDFNTPADGSVTNAKLGSNLTINVADGTAGAPSIQFNGSGTDTGFYSSGADEVAISTSGTERMRIDSNGDVIINDGNNLQVNANTGSGYSRLTAALTTGGAGIKASSGTDTSTFIDFDAPEVSAAGGTIQYRFGRATTVGTGTTASLYFFEHNSTGNIKFVAHSDGKVGIQVGASPSNALELGVDDAAKPSTNTWTITSDSRIKEEIEEANLDICYSIVKSIPLKRYKWKDEVYSSEQVKDRRKIGWIAQDVETYFPKAVSTSDFEYNKQYDEEGNVISSSKVEDCKSLNADQLYAAMYGAVQKLIEKVETLEQRLNDAGIN